MKRKTVNKEVMGSAAYVVAHGDRQRERGRQYSASFYGIVNPRVAYQAAKEVLTNGVFPKRLMDKLLPAGRQPLDYDQYRQLLDTLPITNPTFAQMAAFCPHLEPEVAIGAFLSGRYLACPPLRVKGAFQIVSFSPGSKYSTPQWEGGKRRMVTTIHPPKLSWSYAGRTRESYSDEAWARITRYAEEFRPYRLTEYTASKEACSYAELHWNERLVIDSWDSPLTIWLQDPTQLRKKGWQKKGYPTTVGALYVTFNRSFNDLINDHSKPQSDILDDAIAEVTTDAKVFHELQGDRGGYTEYNCACCGSGLGLSGCEGCGATFDDDHIRCGWYTPLSGKMASCLISAGHKFTTSLAVAWGREKERYATDLAEAQAWRARHAVK